MAQKQKTGPKTAAPAKWNSLVLPAVVAIAGIAFLVWTLTRSRTAPSDTAQTMPPATSAVPAEQQAAPQPQIPPEVAMATEAEVAAVPRISVADLKKELDAGTAVTIDVRDIQTFAVSHIPDALHIPLVYIAGELEYLPKGRKIVPYCT